jgi:hypothetical protein
MLVLNDKNRLDFKGEIPKQITGVVFLIYHMKLYHAFYTKFSALSTL